MVAKWRVVLGVKELAYGVVVWEDDPCSIFFRKTVDSVLEGEVVVGAPMLLKVIEKSFPFMS